MRGFGSAAAAYNAGIGRTSADILVFAHQDVYLPYGWDQMLAAAIDGLTNTDPTWAVLGVFGMAHDVKPRGHMYCTGLEKVLGGPFIDPIACNALDELVLIVRRSSGLLFDPLLPGFHLYGTDICLEARRRGLRSYIIPAFCIHNTAGLDFLPWGFWRAYFFMRRKWWQELPVKTLCTTIGRIPTPLIEHPLRSAYSRYLRRRRMGKRVPNPAALHQELLRSGQVI